ncbi:hypothetical protein GCM10027613_51330 [Microlunatus endophyticus]
MPDLSAERARIYAHEVSEFATAEANEVAVRLQYGARSIAVARFSELWPQHARNPQTRRALQAWYLYAFEQHLAEPVAGTVQTINGKQAGRALATVMEQTRVHHAVTVGVITALAQDARILARKTAVARGQLLEAALNARINRLFPSRNQPTGSSVQRSRHSGTHDHSGQ